MITLYGSVRSSAARCAWCLEEVGAPYQLVPVDMKNKEHKSEEFLRINPNGKVPALKDGDFVLFESMAINFYLAEKYKPELAGLTPAEKGLVQQWSFWANSDLQDPIIKIFIQKLFMPDDKRDQKEIAENLERLPDLFKILERDLSTKKYLAGDRFTLGDLHVCSVVTITSAIGFDLLPYIHVSLWLKSISERPAFKKYQALRH